MPLPFRPKPTPTTRPLTLLTKGELRGWLKKAGATVKNWVSGSEFTAAPGELCLVPGRDGKPARALAGVGEAGSRELVWNLAALATRLPDGTSWRLDPEPDAPAATRIALGWALGGYNFTRYRAAKRGPATLVWPKNADQARVEREAGANTLVRDLINTPTEDMGPGDLARAAKEMADTFGFEMDVVKGDDLLAKNYPLIHAVGRASTRAPRLIDLRWGEADKPLVAILGKGVCFDTGGLDLKNAEGMKMMKKDMGGGAHALGLAMMIAAARLPVRLRVLVPAVENSVAGNAFRPLDIIKSRKGITVEVGNTDAEGRLVLADAMADASDAKPALMIDFATLTGAARVALGPDLPALFCNDDALAAALLKHGEAEGDPMWRLPLWRPYRKMLDSKTADINNIGGGSFAGAVTAALFLQEFVGAGIPWAHFDLYAWNAGGAPGRPEGAEAQVIRAVFAAIAERFAPAA